MKNLIFALVLLFEPMAANAAWETVAPYTATYSASILPVTPYATPTDICMLGGVPGINIRVYHVRVFGTQTTGGVNGFFLIKRSNLDNVGSAKTAMTIVPHDSYTAAPGADVLLLTSAPANLGTQIGIIRGADVFTAAPAGLGNSTFDFDFGPSTGVQPVILHANEMLALNFAGVVVPSGMKISCEFNWTEQ